MKKILMALTIMASTPAFATHGIDCKDIEGSLEISTNEAAASGDNVISIYVKAGKKDLVFDQVAASHEADYPNKIYMGSNSEGDSMVLELNTSVREGIEMSTVYIKFSDRSIVKEVSMVCAP